MKHQRGRPLRLTAIGVLALCCLKSCLTVICRRPGFDARTKPAGCVTPIGHESPVVRPQNVTKTHEEGIDRWQRRRIGARMRTTGNGNASACDKQIVFLVNTGQDSRQANRRLHGRAAAGIARTQKHWPAPETNGCDVKALTNLGRTIDGLCLLQQEPERSRSHSLPRRRPSAPTTISWHQQSRSYFSRCMAGRPIRTRSISNRKLRSKFEASSHPLRPRCPVFRSVNTFRSSRDWRICIRFCDR